MTTELGIMDDVMCAITQTDEWQRIQLKDPRILEAEKELNRVLVQVRPFLPGNLMDELENSARGSIATAYGEVGILYGIHVADAIHAVAAKPTLLSRRIMERLAGTVDSGVRA